MRKISYLTVVFIFLAMACTIPNSPGGSSSELGSTHQGTLTVNIPAVGDWLKPFLSSAKNESRALLRATTVKIWVTTSSGVTVLPTVTQTVSFDSSSTSTGSPLSPISGVPVGSNLTVNVSVYNSYYSGYSPTVQGSATGVTITKGSTTDVTVTCVPYYPLTLVPTVTAAPTISGNSETWYKLTTEKDVEYTLSQSNPQTPTFLFDESGNYLQTITSGTSHTWTDAVATIYYVGVANTSAVSQVAGVLASAVLPPANEGSLNAPVPITVDASRTFILGPTGASDQYSYYTFETGEAGDYYFSAPEGYQNLVVYSEADFTGEVISTYYQGSSWFDDLQANTTYYLSLQNKDSTKASYSGKILSPTAREAATKAEGTPSSPILFSVGSTHVGTVGYVDFNRTSYYTVVTGSGPSYTLSFSDVSGSSSSVFWSLGTEPGSSTYWGNSSEVKSLSLNPNTTYYLQLQQSGSISNTTASSETTFSMLLEATAPPAGTQLTLDTPVQGTLTTGDGPMYYYISLEPGTYTVGWEDYYNKNAATVATADVMVSAYNSDYTSSYFVNYDSGYSTPRSITISGGSAQVLRLIVQKNYYFGTFWISVATPNVGNLAVTVQ